MSKRHPEEIRDDVVPVTHGREPGQHLRQMAADFDISESCPPNWMRAADVEDSIRRGSTASRNAELHEARKRIRLYEQENEVLRRTAANLSEANPPGE